MKTSKDLIYKGVCIIGATEMADVSLNHIKAVIDQLEVSNRGLKEVIVGMMFNDNYEVVYKTCLQEDNGAWKVYVDVEPTAIDLSSVTVEQLKKELESRGYQTSNLWQIEDIDQGLENLNEDREHKVEITDKQKMEIMVDIMSSDGVMESINVAISDYLHEMYPEEE